MDPLQFKANIKPIQRGRRYDDKTLMAEGDSPHTSSTLYWGTFCHGCYCHRGDLVGIANVGLLWCNGGLWG